MLETIHRWDVTAFEHIISSHLNRTLLKFARILSRTGDGWLYPLAPMFAYLLDDPLSTKLAVVGGTAYAFERLVYLTAKRGFKRRRPANVVPHFKSHIIASDEFSFPSGHTSAAFLMASLLVIFFGPAFAPLYLWAAAVGGSRVMLGVHFPTDILVGGLMGSSIAIAIASGYAVA